jgi:cytidylate kinase
MEGRDIGSVIFPDADLRFFLHADPSEKVRRRAREGHDDAVAERDRMDSSRPTAPLSCPAGATVIDSTHLTLEQVIAQAAAPIAARLATA